MVMESLPDDWLLRPAYRVRALSAVTLVCLTVLCLLVLVVPTGRNNGIIGNLSEINPGDTAWSLMATALVLLMVPGVAFFYGGMVKRTNLNTTLSQSMATMSVITILWVVVGFSLAFGESVLGGVIGNPSTYYFYQGVGASPNLDLAPTIPLTLYSLFEAAFAILTPALIAGAVVDRAHFSALLMFCGIWHLVVYCPIAHCTWAPGGLFKKFGHLDFAGGTVVHMASGWTALTLAKLVGYKMVDPNEKPTAAHIPYVMLGTTLMWFGWQGFNGGSALGANYIAAQAILNTNVSAATCLAFWGLWDNMQGRRVTGISLCGGIVCGLVSITPAAGYVTVGGAMAIGGITGIVSNIFIRYFRSKNIVDDTLDVFGCHGVAGTCGMFLTACFATDSVNPEEKYNGLFYGGGTLFWRTLVVALGVIIYCVTVSTVVFHFVNLFIPFRVSLKQEREGLDSSLHGSVHGQLNGFIHMMLPPSLRHSGIMSRDASAHPMGLVPPDIEHPTFTAPIHGEASVATPYADQSPHPTNGFTTMASDKSIGSVHLQASSGSPTPARNPRGGLTANSAREA